MLPSERAEHAFTLPFASVVHDTKGARWVYVGTVKTTVGLSLRFIQEDIARPFSGPHFDYVVATRKTLLEKFPDTERFLKFEDPRPLTGPDAKPLSDMTYDEMRKVYPRE